MSTIDAKGAWWDDEEESEHASSHEVEIRLGYEADTLYIDGLDDGRYLTISLKSIATAIASGVHAD